MPRLFTQAARTGFYLRVLREGIIGSGDSVSVLQRGHGRVPVQELFKAYFKPGDTNAARTLRRGLEVPELSPEWRAQIEKRLQVK